jgi:membrane protein implicated in regulation of membrane protease activity
MAVGWLAAAVVFAIVATLGGGVAVLLWSATHMAALVVGGVAAVSAIVAITGRVRGLRHNGEARKQLEAAQQGQRT